MGKTVPHLIQAGAEFCQRIEGKSDQEVRLVEIIVMTFVKMGSGNVYLKEHIMSGKHRRMFPK